MGPFSCDKLPETILNFLFFPELADQASAVLSGSDEKNCNGFVKRQALYACLTCAPEGAKTDFSKCIGICLACSFKCHENHELVELYTKRNFHCDCGCKEGSVACQLDPTKSSVRTANSYNQNFIGLYCTCHRPYPDPENRSEDEMIQCVVCEDWFHGLHLNAKVPPSEAYGEMICGSCVDKNDFIADYSGLFVNIVEKEADLNTSSILNVTSLDESGTKRPAEDECASNSAKKVKLSDDACTRPKRSEERTPGTAIFWTDGRAHLCKCTDCLKLYADLKVDFITDMEDTTQFYEEKGKSQAKPSNYTASMDALSSLPRVNQIDAISSYNRMKDKLFEFLQTFVTNNQIVTEEDIQRFFRNMKESNEQPAQQPHFCR